MFSITKERTKIQSIKWNKHTQRKNRENEKRRAMEESCCWNIITVPSSCTREDNLYIYFYLCQKKRGKLLIFLHFISQYLKGMCTNMWIIIYKRYGRPTNQHTCSTRTEQNPNSFLITITLCFFRYGVVCWWYAAVKIVPLHQRTPKSENIKWKKSYAKPKWGMRKMNVWMK